ncbi:hypothetical protein ATANTOWER_004269 [Ataeniobius toweri]|uniref:Uncharacterized protein n=1 Tax=Ataeniobius toweri TaxID=208326 RepID=A0ABU7C9G3_9TELE|nr:hypothetical protein [Ataeniobius toweri]
MFPAKLDLADGKQESASDRWVQQQMEEAMRHLPADLEVLPSPLLLEQTEREVVQRRSLYDSAGLLVFAGSGQGLYVSVGLHVSPAGCQGLYVSVSLHVSAADCQGLHVSAGLQVLFLAFIATAGLHVFAASLHGLYASVGLHAFAADRPGLCVAGPGARLNFVPAQYDVLVARLNFVPAQDDVLVARLNFVSARGDVLVVHLNFVFWFLSLAFLPRPPPPALFGLFLVFVSVLPLFIHHCICNYQPACQFVFF